MSRAIYTAIKKASSLPASMCLVEGFGWLVLPHSGGGKGLAWARLTNPYVLWPVFYTLTNIGKTTCTIMSVVKWESIADSNPFFQ